MLNNDNRYNNNKSNIKRKEVLITYEVMIVENLAILGTAENWT